MASIYSPKSNKELKSAARGQLIGKYSGAILAVITISVIQLCVLNLANSSYTGSISSYLLRFTISIIVDLLSGVLVFGQARYFLCLVRGTEPLMIKEIFYGFKNNVDKSIIIQTIFTGISLLADIPAVLITLGYIVIDDKQYIAASLIIYAFDFILIFVTKLFLGLSFYILNDNPDMTVGEILGKSVELMRNKKGRYFLICLSTLPLFILGFLGLFIGSLWVSVYLETLLANFYLDCIKEEPAPVFKEEEKTVFTDESSTSDIH